MAYDAHVEPTDEIDIDKTSRPVFLFAANEYGDAALRCTRAFRKARKFGIPAEIHLGGDDPAGREREFAYQLACPTNPANAISPSKRYASDADRQSCEREALWPEGRMPNRQAHQCEPYLEWHLPKIRTTTTIQIVYAGGGYREYNAQPEPDPVRRYLNSLGVPVVTLRYRTPRPEGLPKHLTAWQDLQRCIRLVRAGAKRRGLDPDRIGLMGFSAGGHLTLLGAVSSGTPAYAPIDEIDRLPCNVQWGVAVYPAYALTDGVDTPNVTRGVDDSAVLVPEFSFDGGTCPMLFLHGSRDHWASMNSVKCWEKLREMHVPAELHTYATRTHCFQYKAVPGTGSYAWLERVRAFLVRRHVLTDYAADVNVFVGTDGHGNTFPGPTWPLGMVQPGPDTFKEYWSCCNGYKWKATTVAGFSQTHLSGTGCPELQDVAMLPFTGDISRETAAYREWAEEAFRKAVADNRGVRRRTLICGEMDKRTERAEVGYYAVTLTNWNVQVELTASKRVAYHRYTFASGKDAHVYVNLQSGPSRWWRHAPPDRISAARSAWDAKDGVLSGYTCPTSMVIDRDVSFALTFSVPPKAARKLEPLDGWKGDRWIFDFDLPDGGSVVAKVAVSTTDEEGAKRNLASDGPGFDFEARRTACRAAWERLLGRVAVTAPDDRKTQLYTALYHAYVQPNVIADVDGAYRNGARKLEKGADFEMYSTFSLWDTFRAAHPLYTILTPGRAADFARSLIAHQQAVGRLTRWETWGRETDDMVALHSVPVIVDAILKGLPGIDPEAAFKAIDESLADRGPLYDKCGYFPWQEHWRATSVTMEWCYDDWCAAVLAERLGKTERAAFYRKRADYWKNLFDPKTGYMRGKDAAGNWHEPFDPFKQRPTESDPWTKDRPDRRTHDYVEGSALQYTWHVFHDPAGLIAAFGGKDPFYAALNRLFTLPERLPGQIMTGESTGCIGQYAHGNEPGHHVPYFFLFVGRSDRTAEIVRQICDNCYMNRPDGVVGNDDCGQMSAWLVFSCMGFYPFNPCGGDYVLGAPQVPRVEIEVERKGGGGQRRVFSVVAKGLSQENKYVKSVRLNGKPLKGFILRHADIMQGGELVFEMTNVANDKR